jgi:hypothetical protein
MEFFYRDDAAQDRLVDHRTRDEPESADGGISMLENRQAR